MAKSVFDLMLFNPPAPEYCEDCGAYHNTERQAKLALEEFSDFSRKVQVPEKELLNRISKGEYFAIPEAADFD